MLLFIGEEVYNKVEVSTGTFELIDYMANVAAGIIVIVRTFASRLGKEKPLSRGTGGTAVWVDSLERQVSF